jgi:hypothetical protein
MSIPCIKVIIPLDHNSGQTRVNAHLVEFERSTFSRDTLNPPMRTLDEELHNPSIRSSIQDAVTSLERLSLSITPPRYRGPNSLASQWTGCNASSRTPQSQAIIPAPLQPPQADPSYQQPSRQTVNSSLLRPQPSHSRPPSSLSQYSYATNDTLDFTTSCPIGDALPASTRHLHNQGIRRPMQSAQQWSRRPATHRELCPQDMQTESSTFTLSSSNDDSLLSLAAPVGDEAVFASRVPRARSSDNNTAWSTRSVRSPTRAVIRCEERARSISDDNSTVFPSTHHTIGEDYSMIANQVQYIGPVTTGTPRLIAFNQRSPTRPVTCGKSLAEGSFVPNFELPSMSTPSVRNEAPSFAPSFTPLYRRSLDVPDFQSFLQTNPAPSGRTILAGQASKVASRPTFPPRFGSTIDPTLEEGEDVQGLSLKPTDTSRFPTWHVQTERPTYPRTLAGPSRLTNQTTEARALALEPTFPHTSRLNTHRSQDEGVYEEEPSFGLKYPQIELPSCMPNNSPPSRSSNRASEYGHVQTRSFTLTFAPASLSKLRYNSNQSGSPSYLPRSRATERSRVEEDERSSFTHASPPTYQSERDQRDEEPSCTPSANPPPLPTLHPTPNRQSLGGSPPIPQRRHKSSA